MGEGEEGEDTGKRTEDGGCRLFIYLLVYVYRALNYY